MTKLLAKVMDEAAKLSEEEQDRWASQWLEELDSERRWDEAFASSEEQLGRLAEEALVEHRMGHTQALDPDTL